jgi:hypothetical protein
VSSSEVATTSILEVDFENYTIGPLGAPWIVTVNSGRSSASTASIINTSDHGKVLRLLGSKISADFLIASLGLSSSDTEVTVEVDVKPEPDSSFSWGFYGAGPSLGSREIRLERAPGSTTLIAQTVPAGRTACGTLLDDWSHITLTIHTQQLPHTFDVAIDGLPTCTGIETGLIPPFSHVSVTDASNAHWGGSVLFDNILRSLHNCQRSDSLIKIGLGVGHGAA